MFDLSQHLATPPEGNLALVILFGGTPTEHNVSRTSAATIYLTAKNRYSHVELIGIQKNGDWILIPDEKEGEKENGEQNVLENNIHGKNTGGSTHKLKTALDTGLIIEGKKVDPKEILATLKSRHRENLVAFPVLHGPGGEDGTIQTLLEEQNIAYVGSSSQASAICMNKIITKELLEEAGLPVVPHITLEASELENDSENNPENAVAVQKKLEGLRDWEPPFILKPANLGSSIGVTLIQDIEDLKTSLDEISHLDNQFLIEPYISGREIECSILESINKDDSGFLSTPPGEIVSTYEIYDYIDKYINNTARLIYKADLPLNIIDSLVQYGVRAAQVLGIEGLARVDFFYQSREEDRIFINEVNTMPGFTPASMYPQMMGQSGISMPVLLDHLIALALHRESASG